MENRDGQRWIKSGTAYDLAKILVENDGGIDEPIGKRLIGLAIGGKVVAVCKKFTGVEKLPEDELAKMKLLKSTMDDDEYFDWQLEDSRKRIEERSKDLPDITLIPRSFWLNFQDIVKLPYHVNQTTTKWAGSGLFGFVKTGPDKRNPYAPVDELIDDDFDMQWAQDVYFLEDSIFYVTVPPKDWEWLDDLEFDRDNYQLTDFSESLELLRQQPASEQLQHGKGNKSRASKGGRRGAKHGDAIASLTLKLSLLDGEALQKYTADSLSIDLKDEYLKIGETPPSQQNLERYSAGILRIVRD